MAINCNAPALPGVVACFQSCIPETMQVAVQNYLWCQIANTSKFGGGGSGPSPPPGLPVPTSFTVTINNAGTLCVSTWDPAPAGITKTEVWTSTDNITYNLSATVLVPTNTNFTAPPAIGTFLWFKIRWCNASACSAFTAPQQISGTVVDWVVRANTNGGTPTTTPIMAVNGLWIALVNGGIDSQIIVLNPIAGIGDLSTSATPLIKGPGTDPWGNHNGNNASSTINGFLPAGAAALLPGFAPTSFASDNNAGFSIYEFTGGSEAPTVYDTGGYDGANGLCSLRANNGGNSVYAMFSLANAVTVASPGAGFYSVNRVAANDLRLFFGNSTNALAQVGATSALAGATRSTINMGFGGLCQNNVGNVSLFTSHTLSFWAAHNGLTLAQDTTLFNAVQAYLVAKGGGFV